MRHGATLALAAWCWMASPVGPGPAWAVPDDGPAPTPAWSLPDASRGHRVAPILLLSRPEIQAELRLKPDQAAAAARVIADARRKAAQLKGRTDQAAVELRRGVDEEQRAWLETKLTEDQVGRLGEIDLQWEGPAALADRPALAESLSLSADQKAAVARAFDDLKKHRARGADHERDPVAVERHFAQQVYATLTDGQRKRWEKMLGHPLAVMAAAPAPPAR